MSSITLETNSPILSLHLGPSLLDQELLFASVKQLA